MSKNEAVRERPIPTGVHQLANLLRRSAVASYGRELGVTIVEWRVISRLGGGAELSLNELSQHMTYDPGQLSRVVTRMATAGVLTRIRRAGRRGALLRLTERGEAVASRLAEFAEARNRVLLDGVSDADLVVFWRVMGALMQNARVLLDDTGRTGTAAG